MRASILALCAAVTLGADLVVDRSGAANTFDGIGGLSGGGATTRLLIDYKEPQRSQVLDYLFKPNFGASLQILKVEIGGDSQSTDGTESSHMHDAEHIDLETGYEWWLMTEAKKRNPDIKLYGLPWAYPGWVGNDPTTGKPSGSPFTYPNQTSHYIMEWVKGAKSKYDLEIDYIGIWNERSSDAAYAESLRSTLDAAGFSNTKIVAKDGGADICNAMANDADYAKTVDIIGLHYPTDYASDNYKTCHSFGKPIWASEESSSYDDLNGAACWGRVINSHFALNGMTASIMWNLVGAYYHGTNWYASSMLTSVEPWSGHYEVNPVIWATAHVTQFTQVGWKYLKVGSGSGKLPNGGYYTAWVDPSGNDFTLNVVKISHEHAPCTRPGLPDFYVEEEEVTFALADNMKAPASLAVWYSNYNTDTTGSATVFEKQADVKVVGGKFTLKVPVGSHFTISTVRTAVKGSAGDIPASSPSFPLPHTDDFENKPVSQEAPFLADQVGAFEVHYETKAGVECKAPCNKVMRQMVPQLPIGWSDHGSYGPYSVIGMREWQDVSVQVDFKLPSTAAPTAAGCVATRGDQGWGNGIALCLNSQGHWNLTVSGPKLSDGSSAQQITSGSIAAPGLDTWSTLELTTVGTQASGSVNGKAIFSGVVIRDLDTGFAGIGANDWFAIEYDNLAIKEAGDDWHPTSPCGAAKAGDKIGARKCAPNGALVDDLQFYLDPNWNLRHVPSGLCATAASADAGASVSLAKCEPGNELQRFVNDYTRIRNTVDPMTLHNTSARLSGNTNGGVMIDGSAGPTCTDPASYNTTDPQYTGTRCYGLSALTSGDGSAMACAKAACAAGKPTYQWKDAAAEGGGCWAGNSNNCEADNSWVGGHIEAKNAAWNTWVYFPNTGQLRNQYVANTGLGYPMCLSTCG